MDTIFDMMIAHISGAGINKNKKSGKRASGGEKVKDLGLKGAAPQQKAMPNDAGEATIPPSPLDA